MNTDKAITVSNVTKRYGELTAVDDVSFEVETGEFFGVLGPNGAGKTTLLEIIEGMRKADSGSVSVLGSSPWPRNRSLLAKIGVQLQASAFFYKLTAREQLDTFADLYNVPIRTNEMLEMVGLSDKADVLEEQLSGGQRQRLSIACSLVHDPDIVFLDAPCRISITSAAMTADEARSISGVESATDDGTTLTLVSREPAPVLISLTTHQLVDGLTVSRANLEDVFLSITGREYRA